MERQPIVILDADTTVTVQDDGEDPIRVKLGVEPYGVTLVANLSEIHRIIIEADRQVSGLVGGRTRRR